MAKQIKKETELISIQSINNKNNKVIIMENGDLVFTGSVSIS